MARYAVIDVGTNSVKFHLGEQHPDGAWSRVVDRAEVTRLGEGLEATGGEFTADAMARSVKAITEMSAEAKRHEVAGIAAVGTMGLRTARNSDPFIAEVEQRCGIRIEVISGEEEARLACLAVKSGLGLGRGSLVIFDTGGGSSQFTFGQDSKVTEQFSLNVGAVRFTEAHGLAAMVTPEKLRQAFDDLSKELARLDGFAPPEALVGLGGAVTNLTAVMLGLTQYDPDAVQGAVLTRAEVGRQIELYRTRSTEARRQIVGLQPKRADVILAGACIVLTVMHKLRQEKLSVSDRGLRHGLLLDRFGG